MNLRILFYLSLSFFFFACTNQGDNKQIVIDSLKKKIDSLLNSTEKRDTAKNNRHKIQNSGFSLNDFFSGNPELEKKTEEIFNALDDKTRIGQMIITSAGENGKPTDYVLKLITKKAVGGVVLMKGSTKSLTELVLKLQTHAKSNGCLPLILSFDAEPTLINKRITDIKPIPKTSSLKTENDVENTAKRISDILKNIGVQQNFAPVVDFGKNKEIISDRSFGSDLKKVNLLSPVFIKTTQSNNIIATAKHFPGHGSVSGDSHKDLVYIEGEMKELSAFENAIKNGVLSVMIGHIVVKNNEFNSDGKPSTMSEKVIRNLLIDKLGFKGLIITDAMNMGAVNKLPSPSMQAVEAGNDMILMPQGEEKLVESVLSKLQSNPEFKSRIYNSVKKIIKIKICLGLI